MRKAVESVSVSVLPALAVVLASCAGVAAPPAGGTEVTSSFEAGGSRSRQTPTTSVELVRGAVYQEGAGRLYVARPRGGIAAIDPATGGELWSRDVADVPLLAVDGRLLARRPSHEGGLELAILDADTGAELAVLHAALPEGIVAPIDDTAAISFEVSARWQEGEAIVDWHYLQRWMAALPPDATSPFARHQTGSLRIDLESARIVGRSSEASALQAGADHPVGAPLPGGIEPPFDPVVSRLPAADGRAVSFSRRHDTNAFERYEWAILDAQDGTLLGSLRARSSASPFVVHGDLVLIVERPYGQRIEGRWVEVPYRVLARRLAGGEEVWAHLLRWTDPVVVPPAAPVPPAG